MRLKAIAEKLGCRLEGDGNVEITGVAGIEHAGPGRLTFLSNPKYRRALATTRAAAILAAPTAGPMPIPVLRSANPYLDFARAIELFHEGPRYAPGIHPSAVVAPTARLGVGCHVGPFCFVDEGAVLGANAVLHSFVVIYRGAKIGDDFFAHAHAVVREGCTVGDRVILQNGVIVGADGFGFARRDDGSWQKIQQTGPAVIEDDVEIQANACVDRATVGETRVRRGAKLDNLVQVGHASTVGENTLLCAQVGLAGTTKIGNNCILAGQVGAAGHLTIGDGAVVSAQSGVPGDVPAGAQYSGYPAMDSRQWRKCVAAFLRLPEMLRTLRSVEEQMEKGRE
ncbi:MAG TPA: UDP-3-O-(3-hydroxymyristoyl)glucosamine N-acyltransferase [Candidatus Binatia bacterium]|nr:UDP-3-O-(3-hydroxymyristoyl)glucosamine N-acyltransferase [Candidatus Binatia bacterium]